MRSRLGRKRMIASNAYPQVPHRPAGHPNNLRGTLGYLTEISNALVKTAVGAVTEVTGGTPSVGGVAYQTDGYVLANALAIPMVIIGPAQTHMTRQQDEYVDIDRLLTAARILYIS